MAYDLEQLGCNKLLSPTPRTLCCLIERDRHVLVGQLADVDPRLQRALHRGVRIAARASPIYTARHSVNTTYGSEKSLGDSTAQVVCPTRSCKNSVDPHKRTSVPSGYRRHLDV